MKNNRRALFVVMAVVAAGLSAASAAAQDRADRIPDARIAALRAKLATAGEPSSPARKKLELRRVIRELNGLLEDKPAAPNRYEVLGVLFRGQQQLVQMEGSAANRAALIGTCKKLAAAPNEYAAVRLDADLLLSQIEIAKQGADLKGRGEALLPLVTRYQDTEVETKVIRIAMIMALEFGDTRAIGKLRQVVAERCPGDPEMIRFQRDKLAGQVFGAPFVGTFERGDGKTVRFPMDFLGTTTAIYCWSKENGGVEDLKALAAAWKKAKVEMKAAGRFRFVSMNMDDLPDAGEGVLREHGLDWPALKMPGGRDNPIYQTYVNRDVPTILTVTPTGYAAIYLSGGRSNRAYERRLQSMMAREWAQSRYATQLQSVFAGEFLVTDPQADFDPAAPPEYKAIATGDPARQSALPRAAASVPEDTLRAIQACFVDPPTRYSTPHDQVVANYQKADALCRAAIAAHPKAPDLWIVRNRRIAALMGLWRTRGDQDAFAAAVAEAKTAIERGYPEGTDVVARLCLARQALRAADAEPKAVIRAFIAAGATGKQASGPALAAATLLALDAGDRLLHDSYRRTLLDEHADDPTMWTATAFLLDRYQRYWMYHPPFTAGWTYGRRQGYFLTVGTPEDAHRTFQTELKTPDGQTVKIPASDGKWTVISFVPSAAGNGYLRGHAAFAAERPFGDVNLVDAVLDDDADAARKLLAEKKKPDPFPTLLVPDGMHNPLVRKLGILPGTNVLILRPDGSIANALSGLTMSRQKGSVIRNAIELHDEMAVDEALARGDLDEARRLAFAYAPTQQLPPPDAPRNWKPRQIAVPHLRGRAKVYMAMKQWQAAYDDIQAAYLRVNSTAGYLSMRTDELDKTEKLKARIAAALEQSGSTK